MIQFQPHWKSPKIRHTKLSSRSDSRNLQAQKWMSGSLKWHTLCASSFESGSCFYGECKTEHAVDLRLPQWDVESWTMLISHHTKSGQSRLALRIYREMLEGRVNPTTYTFVAALKACRSLKDLEIARQIHGEVVKTGFESDVYVGTVLIDVYAKCGSLVDARCVFEKMTNRNVVSWTAMILGYAQMEEGDLALQLYKRMRLEGVLPNSRTFVGALKAYSSLAACKEGNKGDGIFTNQQFLEQVKAIHSDILKGGFESDVYVGTMLVDVYAKCGCLVDARIVFNRMPHRNVVSWTAMILGYAQMEDGEEALQLYSRMQQQGFVPNDRTYVGALKACSSLAASEARNNGNSKHVRQRCLDQVRAIHSELVQCGSETSVFLGSMLVDGYAKCGSLVDARHVFDKMHHRNVVSWNAMIQGYAQMENGEEALRLFAEMQRIGVMPDDVTFVSVLKACSTVAGLEKGKEIHIQILESGRELTNSLVASCLVDMYAKCGSIDDARQVFDSLSPRRISIWNALIAGYARQGNSDDVFNLFERMKQECIQPNAITFLSVLSACSHVGLLHKGKSYFEAMSRDFGIIPSIEHYTCMIDLLGRAGEVENAITMAKTMCFQPDSAVWETVLGACRKWGKVEIGREAFERAVGLDSSNAAAYVVMSNIYADAHMWDEVKDIQDMRVKTGAWKQPGQTLWADLGGTVHSCAVGDKDITERQDMYAKLRFIMKEEEHMLQPDSSFRAMLDEGGSSCCVSKKLIVAYALLKSPKPDECTVKIDQVRISDSKGFCHRTPLT